MSRRKTNPAFYKALVYMVVAVACYALMMVKIYLWEEKVVLNFFIRDRLAELAIVVIVVVAAYLLYERLLKSID